MLSWIKTLTDSIETYFQKFGYDLSNKRSVYQERSIIYVTLNQIIVKCQYISVKSYQNF